MNGAALLWGVVFGSIGLGYFLYGRKQKSIVPLACGVLLMGFSYFVENTTAVVVVGATLMAAPCFLRL